MGCMFYFLFFIFYFIPQSFRIVLMREPVSILFFDCSFFFLQYFSSFFAWNDLEWTQYPEDGKAITSKGYIFPANLTSLLTSLELRFHAFISFYSSLKTAFQHQCNNRVTRNARATHFIYVYDSINTTSLWFQCWVVIFVPKILHSCHAQGHTSTCITHDIFFFFWQGLVCWLMGQWSQH